MWKDLSMKERAAMIKVAVNNGITNLDEIRNRYDEGGLVDVGLNILKLFGVDKKYKKGPEDKQYRENIYNMVNPMNAYPSSVADALVYKGIADDAMKDTTYKYTRDIIDESSDAAWAKRLGLPYDETLLISNPDSSVRLSKKLENEIPIDTVFLKNRIADNATLLRKYEERGVDTPERRQAIKLGMKYDKDALDSLRVTYKTGKPVVINEHSNNTRKWVNDGLAELKPSPLNLLQNYTVRYNKDTNEMEYYDIYDFNKFEDFVPGEPFKIKGSIKLKGKKK
jgi:hypothetical protein